MEDASFFLVTAYSWIRSTNGATTVETVRVYSMEGVYFQPTFAVFTIFRQEYVHSVCLAFIFVTEDVWDIRQAV